MRVFDPSNYPRNDWHHPFYSQVYRQACVKCGWRNVHNQMIDWTIQSAVSKELLKDFT